MFLNNYPNHCITFFVKYNLYRNNIYMSKEYLLLFYDCVLIGRSHQLRFYLRFDN